MKAIPVNQRLRIHILQLGAVLVSGLMLVIRPVLENDLHEAIEMTGIALVLVCIAGRMWSILFIGERKNAELVTGGPYSMMRNPLYFFSTIGATGVGLMLGSFIMTALLVVGTYLVLGTTARHESDYLRSKFGAAYDEYAKVTPMFWPNPRLYREPEQASFSPQALRRTFFDGLFFLLVFTLVELVEYAQETGHLPVLFNLY